MVIYYSEAPTLQHKDCPMSRDAAHHTPTHPAVKALAQMARHVQDRNSGMRFDLAVEQVLAETRLDHDEHAQVVREVREYRIRLAGEHSTSRLGFPEPLLFSPTAHPPV